MDIDGLIEYHNKCYVIYEAKHVDAPPMSEGQKLALERLCDDLQKVKPTLLIICEHDTPSDTPIDFASCTIKQYRYGGNWRYPTKPVNAKRMSDKFIERYGK